MSATCVKCGTADGLISQHVDLSGSCRGYFACDKCKAPLCRDCMLRLLRDGECPTCNADFTKAAVVKV